MRIAHATDIHWFVPPPLPRIPGKRTLGTATLYGRGRRHHFHIDVQTALVDHIVGLEPDLVIITGDLTAQALPEEFELAKTALQPILSRFPTFVQSGNHDVYTGGSFRTRRLAAYFAEWMHETDGDPVARLDQGTVTILGLDPCRPHWSASGRVPQEQLDRLAAVLEDDELAGRSIVLATHYPVVDRRGHIYDGALHGLRNASDLLDVLRAAPHKPVAYLHGHKHHGYRVDVPLHAHVMTSFDPGSSGYAFDEKADRAACMNLYTLNADGRLEPERFRFDGRHFSPESGGAYASGR
ncbi:MAG: metallophosphoesterase [Myxococcota bacterium]